MMCEPQISHSFPVDQTFRAPLKEESPSKSFKSRQNFNNKKWSDVGLGEEEFAAPCVFDDDAAAAVASSGKNNKKPSSLNHHLYSNYNQSSPTKTKTTAATTSSRSPIKKRADSWGNIDLDIPEDYGNDENQEEEEEEENARQLKRRSSWEEIDLDLKLALDNEEEQQGNNDNDDDEDDEVYSCDTAESLGLRKSFSYAPSTKNIVLVAKIEDEAFLLDADHSSNKKMKNSSNSNNKTSSNSNNNKKEKVKAQEEKEEVFSPNATGKTKVSKRLSGKLGLTPTIFKHKKKAVVSTDGDVPTKSKSSFF